jgi:hypothetical protein
MAAFSQAQITTLRTAQDAILTALATGSGVVEYQINNRRVRKETRVEMMKALEDITKMIVLAESMLESPVPVVNYAQLRRD